MANESSCRLYLVSPTDVGPDFGEDLKRAADGGDIACFQLRLKEASDDAVLRTVETLLPITNSNDIALIVNDRPALAAQSGADGVHVGQNDTGYAEARQLVGSDAIVGVTCHNSRDLALTAADAGADYVAFGAFYDSATKPPKFRADPGLLEWWSALVEVPCVAIGGITATNCAPLVRAGADFIAVVSAVWDHPSGPAAGVKAMNEAIAEAQDG